MSWQNDLETDLDWRFEELAVLKMQAARAQNGSLLQRALLRALVAMVYAHYEGFCKSAIRLYLRQIKAAGIRREQCLEKLAVFSLQKSFRGTKSYSADQCWEFFSNSLHMIMAEVIDYEVGDDGEISLEGDSNLYPGLLRSNLQSVCLPHHEVDVNEHLLKTLVGRRNGIAHGKKLEIADLGSYEQYEQAASEVMYGIAYAIIHALDNCAYMKSPVYQG